MTDDLTVDASVWIAAADPVDVFHARSREFLAAVGRGNAQIIVPSFALVEVACALARKHRDPDLGRRLAHRMLPTSEVVHVSVDALLLALAVQRGTDEFLRGADALYAATARLTDSTLISCDQELVRRASAVTPTDWLATNP